MYMYSVTDYVLNQFVSRMEYTSKSCKKTFYKRKKNPVPKTHCARIPVILAYS